MTPILYPHSIPKLYFWILISRAWPFHTFLNIFIFFGLAITLSWFSFYLGSFVFGFFHSLNPSPHTTVISYFSSVHCSFDSLCPLWSNLPTFVNSPIFVSFGLTNLFPALNSKYAKHILWYAHMTVILLSLDNSPFCIPYLCMWYHHV